MNRFMESVLHLAELERAMTEMHDIEHAFNEGKASLETMKEAHKNCRERFALWSESVDVLGASVSRELDAIRHTISNTTIRSEY